MIGQSGPGKGTSVKWPVGLGGKGNEGVAGMIRQMDGGFGYIELIYAVQNNIPYGIVKNAAGDFLKASVWKSATAAAASVKKCQPTSVFPSPTLRERMLIRSPASPGC